MTTEVIRQWCGTCQAATPSAYSWGREFCAVCDDPDVDDDDESGWDE